MYIKSNYKNILLPLFDIYNKILIFAYGCKNNILVLPKFFYHTKLLILYF